MELSIKKPTAQPFVHKQHSCLQTLTLKLKFGEQLELTIFTRTIQNIIII